MTLKKKWFTMIAIGTKKEEYREIKPYWIRRLLIDVEVRDASKTTDYDWLIDRIVSRDYYNVGYGFQEFDVVSANNGYQKNCPNIQWEHKKIRIGKPNPAWCELEDVGKTLFILEIGEVLK